MDSKVVIQPEDYKYYVATPSPSFNPRRNQAIIQETITETEQYFKTLQDSLDSEARNRIDIVGSYARYRFNIGQKPFREYVGNRLYKELIGEKIMSKVRIGDSVGKLKGRKNLILT